MIDFLQLLQASLPYVALVFIYAAFHRLSNATISMSWAAKTSEPERDATNLRMSVELKQAIHERDEARREAERMRGTL